MKRLLTIILCLIMAISLIPFCVAAECSVSVNDVAAEQGDDITVEFAFSASEGIAKVNSSYTYNASALQFASATTSFGGICDVNGSTLTISDSGDGSAASYSVTLVFKPIKAGSSQVNLASSLVENAAGESLGTPTASSSIAVSQQSSDCTLKALGIPAGCTLSPAFVSTVTSYSCTVPYEVTSFPINEVTTDPEATTKIDGNLQLAVGKNVRTITVTAPSGAQKIYSVTIIREAAAEPTAPPKLTITSGSTTYTLSYTVSEEAPAGFTKSTFEYKGSEVECYISGNVRLVEISNNSRTGLCVYDEETETFSKYSSISSEGKTYTVFTVAPDSPGSEYTTETITVGETEYLSWSGSSLESGYHIIYVLNNETGEKYFAIYCEYDGSIQKMMSTFGAKEVTVRTVNTASRVSIKLVAAIVVVILGIIVLLAVLIKKFIDWRVFKVESGDELIKPDETFTQADIEIFEQMRAEEEAKNELKKKKKQ